MRVPWFGIGIITVVVVGIVWWCWFMARKGRKSDDQAMADKRGMGASPVKTNTTGVSRLGHWVRVIVMCLSFGFIFPHVLTEDDEIATQDAGEKAKLPSSCDGEELRAPGL